jgi:hypothetical protein
VTMKSDDIPDSTQKCDKYPNRQKEEQLKPKNNTEESKNV